MVCHQDGLSSGWSVIRVVSHQGGLSSGWSVIRMVSHQDGLSSGVSSHIYLAELPFVKENGQLLYMKMTQNVTELGFEHCLDLPRHATIGILSA